MFPNPTTGIVSFNIESGSQLEYKVYATSGKLMCTGAAISSIDLTDLEKGIYFLEVIKDNNLSYFSKVVVSR